jgi:integrase
MRRRAGCVGVARCLRRTFASLLIAAGKPIVYVLRQLGHASITLTVDTYGKWQPMAD